MLQILLPATTELPAKPATAHKSFSRKLSRNIYKEVKMPSCSLVSFWVKSQRMAGLVKLSQ